MASVATVVVMQGLRVEVRAAGTGNVRIWTEFENTGNLTRHFDGPQVSANSTNAQAIAALKDELKNYGQNGWQPGLSTDLTEKNHLDDNAAGYNNGFRVEVDGTQATSSDIAIQEIKDSNGTIIGKRARLIVDPGRKVKIWVKLPKPVP